MLKIEHTICPTCSVGCGLNIISKNNKLVGIDSYKNHEINEGRNCHDCTNNINLFKNNKITLTNNYDDLINETVDLLKNNKKEVTFITSGKIDNEDLTKIIDFTNKQGYNLLSYEYNFCDINSELIPTYDEIENADTIITIGDIYRENSLAARRIVHAKNNGCYTININKTNNLTGYNSDEYIKIDSYDQIVDIIYSQKLNDNSIIIINTIDSKDNYKNIIKYVEENNLKILPLLKYPNSYSVLKKTNSSSIKEIISAIENSGVLIFTDIHLTNFMRSDVLKNKKIISFDSIESMSNNDVSIPIRAWYEKDGSFTNSIGLTQTFEDTIKDDENPLKTISQIIEEIDDKL